MTTRMFAAVFLLISLLTQQVSAGVIAAAMSGDFSSSMSSEMSSGQMMSMSHQHHQIASGADMNDDMDMEGMDCCQNDCANCLASCQHMMFGTPLRFSSTNFKEAIQLNSSEPLVQSPTSPFRPPIAA